MVFTPHEKLVPGINPVYLIVKCRTQRVHCISSSCDLDNVNKLICIHATGSIVYFERATVVTAFSSKV